MKRAYGEYQYTKGLEHLFGKTYDEISSMVRDLYTRRGIPCDVPSMDAETACWTAWALIEDKAKSGECLHLFFTGDGMEKWLSSCSTKIQDEQIALIRGFAAELKAKDTKAVTFMLHFPGGGSCPYLCAFGENLIGLRSRKEVDGWSMYVFRGAKHRGVWWSSRSLNCDDEEIVQVQSLVSSALAYIQCFPTAVS